MRTSFHHQPEAQHPNFPLSTSGQADYPIFLGYSGREMLAVRLSHFDPMLLKKSLMISASASI